MFVQEACQCYTNEGRVETAKIELKANKTIAVGRLPGAFAGESCDMAGVCARFHQPRCGIFRCASDTM
jgi:hypothetical protein